MRWIGTRRQAAQKPSPSPSPSPSPESSTKPGQVALMLDRLRAGSAVAERAGRQGRADEAVRYYRDLAAEAAHILGPGDPTTLAFRHQLAHWTGESGAAETAVGLFERLVADRELVQGERHPDTDLARHQLAHWHGRAGRCHEAVRRYGEMRATAEREGRTETALSLLCDMGHWQQEGGDTASALRTYSRMAQIADRELGHEHWISGVARQRYAELAGGLPFGHERGANGLRDLLAAAEEVEKSGDFLRAGRMYGQIAEKCERSYGADGPQTVNARAAQARAAARAGDTAEAGASGPASAPAPEPAPRGRTVFNPQAEAIGDWREVKRARPARAADDPQAFGPYEVLELVGQGGFGSVHLCQDADGILVAVKTLHPRLAADPVIRRGFAHEVRAARRVEGRFTVPVIAADTDGETPWMAVPYVAAPSLQELVDHCGSLDAATVAALGAGIATALTAIHAEGIVHLDLKPANVLLTEDGPRVIDFGIAQIERLTEPRRGFAGTYAYASPEQLDRHEHFTPASDVFSLGTLLSRLALGRPPWPDGDARPVADGVRSGRPDLAGLPSELSAVVEWCLRLDPADRPTPAQVAAALLPGRTEGGAGRRPLSEEAENLIRERTVLTRERLTRAGAAGAATFPYPRISGTRARPTAVDPRDP